MRKQRNLLHCLFCCLIFIFTFPDCFPHTSADTNAHKYFPLNAGNIFVYDYYFVHVSPTNPSSQSGTKAIYVSAPMFYNGKRYFSITGLPFINNTATLGFFRTDTITGSLMNYNPNNNCPYYHFEVITDSLGALTGDTVRSCNLVSSVSFCTNITETNIFGTISNLKKFTKVAGGPNYSHSYYREYAKNWGLFFCKAIERYSSSISYSDTTYYRLKGCVLNGVLYGDTTQIPVTSITQVNNIVPENYSVSQIYPNPFNPSTSIQFAIPNKSNVKLTVYDALGKELGILVNESLNPGSYNYEWNASGFTSGVYFYRLEANDFTETKRMVLIK